MEQRNILVIVGIALLTAVLVWIASTNITYQIPTEADGAIPQDAPIWARALGWQGNVERSIRIHQGLDLQGGVQVVLEADPAPGQELPEEGLQAVRTVVENRVNALGVTEPLVQLQGDNRMIVELPGISDPEGAIRTIRETGLLEFVDAGRLPPPEGSLITTSLGGPTVEQDENFAEQEGNAPQTVDDQVYETVITGAELDSVGNAGLSTSGNRQVDIPFTLTSEGGQQFGQYSAQNIGNFLCIVLDKVVLSCPVIQAQITTQGQISLGTTPVDEAQQLAIQLRYGSLPIPLQVVETRSVGPTLGADSVERSINAGTVGLAVVLLFMVVYYRLPGFTAALSMIIYGLLNFGIYKLIPVTLTLPAITGFILSLGMAVDANILIFERMKEELRAGKSLKRSTELGFERSFPAIRDSAITTLITCLILFWFGSNFGASIVVGFAVTLAIGVITNLFTAITVTRAFMRFMVGAAGDGLKNNPLLMGITLDKGERTAPRWFWPALDIVGKRRWYYIFSAFFIIPGIIGMIVSIVQFGTPLRLSIDFTSGSLMELQFEGDVSPNEVREVFTNFTYEGEEFNDTSVTTAEQLGDETILVRSKFLSPDAKVAVQDQIEAEVGEFTELRFDSVGPAIGEEVTRAGSFAVVAAAVAILLFLVFAFRSVPNAIRYGVAAVVAMSHDILITVGLFAIFGLILGWEIDALFLTAVLTVIGYSVHDTIIVFDRLRENLPRWRTEDYNEVANRSLLETMNRSIVTSLSTLFVIASILIFGGATITQFVATIMIGIISGTYSSIFNAVPFLVSWKEGELGSLVGRGDNVRGATAQS